MYVRRSAIASGCLAGLSLLSLMGFFIIIIIIIIIIMFYFTVTSI